MSAFGPGRGERAHVRAVGALSTIESGGPLEQPAAWLLLCVYKRRLQGVVTVAPSWMVEEILSASERIGDRRTVAWMSGGSREIVWRTGGLRR